MMNYQFPHRRSIALLVDPDKPTGRLKQTLSIASTHKTDYILVGGSLTHKRVDSLIANIKQQCSIPVVLFPGNLLQLSLDADIIMLLSLLSGRNPELLIGNHVIAAPFLKSVREKVHPVGYVLILCGSKTSVEYISQTSAIPMDKSDITVATALAGEMLGMKSIYLEAGSGAVTHVPTATIKAVRENITIPLIVGGGIRKPSEVEEIFNAGADMIVLGNSCEEDPGFLAAACEARDSII